MKKVTLLLLIPAFLALSGCQSTIETANTPALAEFDNASVRQVLNNLIQHDIDIYHIYHQTADNTSDTKLKRVLLAFAADHEKHVHSLSKIVLDLHGHPPGFSRDFKGVVTSSYMLIKTAGGKRSILNGMETNEVISNRYYRKALAHYNMPANIKAVLQSFLQNEEHHLDVIYDMQAHHARN